MKPVLLVRADGNSADAAALAALGIDSVSESYLEIHEVADKTGRLAATTLLADLAELKAGSWVVATSLNALRFWHKILVEAGATPVADTAVDTLTLALQAAQARGVRFAAIGAATAQKYSEFGIDSVLVPTTSTSAGLAEMLLAASAPATALIPAGNLAMPTLTSKLSAAGWRLISQVVYETATVAATPKTAEGLKTNVFGAVLLRSPSAANALVQHAGQTSVPLICGGPTTAQAARQLGLNVAAIAPETNPEAIAATIFEVLKGEN